jgi:arginine utilization regulatory protein
MANDSATNLAVAAHQPRSSLSLVSKRRAIAGEQYECLIGISANITGLKEFIAVQACHSQPSLFIGERGLRQEQIARTLHEAGDHWERPFFAVNAHSLSSEALHGLLFGRHGMMETIEHGTIYINELTGLPILLQQRFAAYLEEQRWHGRSSRYAKQRLIFSTEFNPLDRTAENRLAYGLVELLRPNSFTLKPLRERSEDLPYLVNFLLARLSKRLNKGACEIAPEAMQLLMEFAWDRNIDELEAVLESAINILPPRQIEEAQLPARIRHAKLRSIPNEGVDLPGIVDDFERTLIETALKQAGGSQTKASRLLGLRVQTLNMKLKRYDEQGRSLRHALVE